MEDFQMWAGGAVLAAGSAFITRLLTKGSEADAEFRAKVLADFGRVLEKLSELSQWSARQDERINTLAGRLDALEKRQEAQAERHRAEIRELQESRRG